MHIHIAPGDGRIEREVALRPDNQDALICGAVA
jgi:hypothetical protein